MDEGWYYLIVAIEAIVGVVMIPAALFLGIVAAMVYLTGGQVLK
jgi:hypothetical protein